MVRCSEMFMIWCKPFMDMDHYITLNLIESAKNFFEWIDSFQVHAISNKEEMLKHKFKTKTGFNVSFRDF